MFLAKVVCITHHENVISIHTFTYYTAFKTKVVSPTIICHIMICLLHVLASTWPSTWRSRTKKITVADSVKRYAYVESKIQYFKIKLLKILRCRLFTITFISSYQSLQTSIYMNMSSFWGSYPCVVSMC